MANYDVFISYSRIDTNFVRALEAALKTSRRAAWVDWQGIDYSTKWWDEICAGIERSHHFILVMSPDSLNSVYCHREIEYARRQGKHIIPLLYRPVNEVELIGGWYTHDEMKPVEELARVNWTTIKSIQWIQYEKLGRDIAATLAALGETIDRDPACIEAHTRLLLQMQTWQQSGRSPSALLSGDILTATEEHLQTCAEKVTFTPEQQEFVMASRQAEDTRTQRIIEDNRRTRRLRWAALTAAIVGILALVASAGAVSQMVNARNNAATAQAEVASAQAEGTRIGLDIMGNEAQLQAGRAQAALAEGDRDTAVRLALDSLHDYPVVFKSESSLALSSALSTPGREIFKAQYPGRLSGITWNANQTQILAWGVDGTASVYAVGISDPIFSLKDPDVPALDQVGKGDAEWNPNETRIFTVTDYAVTIWDATSGKKLLTLPHEAVILGARWNKDGSEILTWGDTGAWLWNAETGGLLNKFEDYNAVFENALWSPSETRILTWARDSTIRVWNISSGMQEAFMQHDSIVQETETSSVLHSIIGAVWKTDGTQILTWSTDKTARVWDAATGKRVLTLTHTGAVKSAAWNSDNTQILTASADKTARVWDAVTGKQLLSLNHDSTVLGAVWDEDKILTWEQAGVARTWEISDGSLINLMRHSTPSQEDAIAPPTMGAVSNRDTQNILTWGSDWLRLWGQSGYRLIASLPFQTEAADPFNQVDIAGAQIGSNGKRILAWTQNGAIRIWSTDGGANALTFDSNSSSNGAAWSKDFQRVLTWSLAKDGHAAVYEAATGKRLLLLNSSQGIYSAVWSADESRILTRGLDNVVHVWDARIGYVPTEQNISDAQLSLRHDDLQAQTVSGAAFSPDGQRIATWTFLGVVRIWDATTGSVISQMGKDVSPPQSFVFTPRGAIWSADSRRLLNWTGDDVLHIWDTATGQSLMDMHHDNSVMGAIWNHDETHVLSWSLDGTLHLWNTSDGSQVFSPVLVGSEQVVGVGPRDFASSAIWNHDESRILVTTGAGYVEIYDATTGQRQMRFGQRNGGVSGAVWSPDETRVLSWSNDGSVEVGDATTGETIIRVIHLKNAQGAAWSANGKRILTWSWDNTARVWDATTGEPILLLQHPAWVWGAAWNQDETHLLTWSLNDTTRLWDVSIEGMITAAKRDMDTQ